MFITPSKINLSLIFLIALVAVVDSSHFAGAQRTSQTKKDSAKIKQNSQQLKKPLSQKTATDTLLQNSMRIDSFQSESYLDSVTSDKVINIDDEIAKAAPYDTVNKIRLPINLKKNKFAYFDASQSLNRVIPNFAFTVGEKLSFVIRYGVVVAGSSTMSIPNIVTRQHRECFQIQTEARSSSFFSAFFKVRDKVISYLDKNGLYTWGFEKHLQEGTYRAHQIVDYDQIHGWAVSNSRDSLQIPPCVQDVLTSFYFIRTQKLQVGKSLFLDNHADNKLYPLEIKVHKRETIKVRAGKFDCLVVEPILRASGIFKSKGRLLVWLTDDERKIPVQMKSKIIIGYITAELEKMEGVLND